MACEPLVRSAGPVGARVGARVVHDRADGEIDGGAVLAIASMQLLTRDLTLGRHWVGGYGWIWVGWVGLGEYVYG